MAQDVREPTDHEDYVAIQFPSGNIVTIYELQMRRRLLFDSATQSDDPKSLDELRHQAD